MCHQNGKNYFQTDYELFNVLYPKEESAFAQIKTGKIFSNWGKKFFFKKILGF
jgi:hypothetical protein